MKKSDACQPELLQAWFDGEATDFGAARLRAHSASCAECTERLEAWRMLRSLAAGAREQAPPREAWGRIEARIRTGGERRHTHWVPLAVAAALALAVCLAQLLRGPEWPTQGWDGFALGTAEPSREWLASQVPPPETQYQTGRIEGAP